MLTSELDSTSRRRPRRPTATSPARPEADSRPVSATVVSVKANRKPAQVGVVPRAIGSSQHVGFEHEHQAQHDQPGLQHEVDDGDDGHARVAAGAEAAQVGDGREHDDRHRDRELGPAVPERAPERAAEVVRRGEPAHGEQEHVVEQDRPAGDEAPQLVERVAREHGGAAAVLVQRGALDVGHRGQGEEHAAEQEHERREPQRVVGDDAEREVDRAGHRRVDDREQRRRAQRAAERRHAGALLAHPGEVPALVEPVASPSRTWPGGRAALPPPRRTGRPG